MRGCAHDRRCNFPFGKLLVILRRSRFGASASRFCLLGRLRLLSTRKSSTTAYRVAICGGFAAFSEMTHRGYVVRTYEKNAVCDGVISFPNGCFASYTSSTASGPPSPQGEGLLNSTLWVKQILKNYLPQKQNESSVIESSASVASLVQREVANVALRRVTEGL